jgi:hypothetical protein
MDDRQPTGSEADALLATFLADRDVPCPRCGYNLRTLLGTRCTECGAELQLGVSAVEPFLRPWIAATVVTSISSGIGVLFLAIIFGSAGLPPSDWYWVVAISWACIPLAAALALQRRRITRWPAWVQWSLAGLMGLVLLVLIVGVAKNVR